MHWQGIPQDLWLKKRRYTLINAFVIILGALVIRGIDPIDDHYRHYSTDRVLNPALSTPFDDKKSFLRAFFATATRLSLPFQPSDLQIGWSSFSLSGRDEYALYGFTDAGLDRVITVVFQVSWAAQSRPPVAAMDAARALVTACENSANADVVNGVIEKLRLEEACDRPLTAAYDSDYARYEICSTTHTNTTVLITVTPHGVTGKFSLTAAAPPGIPR